MPVATMLTAMATNATSTAAAMATIFPYERIGSSTGACDGRAIPSNGVLHSFHACRCARNAPDCADGSGAYAGGGGAYGGTESRSRNEAPAA
jgi:hypothetical protein